ncbi:hypothetical protein H5410_002743 [Solanum commersonii]|uniref:Uncharacterized protein n=1 Tax=Solanum commersonii TaxID=4109 RepID=A0A9J6B369_SOLCO|nr:hypothetical protein H5410_002743 [Solanum commersonii]
MVHFQGTSRPNSDCSFSPTLEQKTRCDDLVTRQIASAIRRSLFLRSFSFLCSFLVNCVHAFVSKSKYLKLKFRKDVSNSATEDSIMNAHNKTQFTYENIKCALKDSSFDSPLSKNLVFTILASKASSSSIIVFKCPHTKNDSIFTHNELII